MRKLAIALAVGAAVIVAPLAAEAHHKDGHDKGVDKVELCHWADNDNQYVEIRIPAKQLARGKGHARHEHDRLVPAEGCDSLPDPEA